MIELALRFWKPLAALACIAIVITLFFAWLHEHDKNTLAGYVALSEKTAAEAQAAKEEHDRIAAQQALEESRKRELSATQAKDKANAELAKRIAADTDGGCSWSSDDDAFRLRKH